MSARRPPVTAWHFLAALCVLPVGVTALAVPGVVLTLRARARGAL
jgi:hypothetical protein